MNRRSLWASLLFILFCTPQVYGQYAQGRANAILERIGQLQLENKQEEAIGELRHAIDNPENTPDDLAYLYAFKSGIYVSMDSLLLGKEYLDRSMEYARSDGAKAAVHRASAFLNNYLDKPDEVVKEAIAGLKYLEGNDEELVTKYYLNYLLYSTYSKWDDREKMEKYIRTCEVYARQMENPNLLANVNNGISSMYLAEYRKSQDRTLLDSSYHYLQESFAIQQRNPDKVSGNTFAITCINLANYFMVYSTAGLPERKEQAYFYLDFVEKELRNERARTEQWVNVFGIKSGFADLEGDVQMAEAYLLQGLEHMQRNNKSYFRQEYSIYKNLADIALRKRDFEAAYSHQRNAEKRLRQIFDQQQMLNAQRLEVQYEIESKDKQLQHFMEISEYRKRQNYLYGGLMLVGAIGVVFMFGTYHFRLRYSVERERKLAQEKEDIKRQSAMHLQIEREEQARLKAEQEVLALKRQQLEKEALANSIIIAQKNDMLRQIETTLKEGGAVPAVKKLLKEDALINADFEDVKLQIQQTHPDFFNQLQERAVQKLTARDLKYCTYLYLQMTTKQIAQTLHVEPQSVRMFKYRLKQKLGLDKDSDLYGFIQRIGS